MSDLNRKENESFFEWKLRLSLMKLNHEIDEDWQELIDILGLDMSPCHYRKISYGYKEYDEYIKSKTKEMIAEEEYQKLINKEIELEKKKVKIRDMQTQLNKQIREQARHEDIFDVLNKKMDELNMSSEVINDDVIYYDDSNKEGILIISDVHYGETIDIFLNKYDSNICEKRMNKLINKTIEYCEINKINTLNVFILGDLISNEHYTTIRLNNRENIIEQIIGVSKLLSNSMMKLSKHINKIKIGMTTGNHERIHEKKENLNKDNYVLLIKEFLMTRLENVNNISFVENKYDNEVVTMEICGLNVVGTHGDKVDRKQMAYQLSSLLKQPIQILLVGHFHEMASQVHHETLVVRNGSMVGSNEYSRNLNLHTIPCQRLLIVNEEGCECTYDIKLNEV